MEINKSYPCHTSNYRKTRRDSVKYIVIHYVGATGGALDNVKYYGSAANLNASAHYYVGHASESGAVYQSVDDKACAFHCGTSGKYYHECRNDSSIGIEMCCHIKSNEWYFDAVTVEKTIELTRELMKKYNIPAENVIRHYDVTHKLCPAPFVNDTNSWNDFKKRLEKEVYGEPMSAEGFKELETVNDIVWFLGELGIITDKDLWLKKLKEDTNSYWIVRKLTNYIRKL